MPYFHATPAENQHAIFTDGLTPSHAPECNCNYGIHLTKTYSQAED